MARIVVTNDKLVGVKPRISAVLRPQSGTPLSLSDRDFVSDSLSFDNSVSNPGEITVGAVFIGSCKFDLWNDTGKFKNFNWTNAAFDITLTFGSTPIIIGTYFVADHRDRGYTISVESYDMLSVIDGHQLYEVGLTYPIDSGDAMEALVHFGLSNVRIADKNTVTGITLHDPGDDTIGNRDAMAYIAQCCGVFGSVGVYQSEGAFESVMRFWTYYNGDDRFQGGTTFSHQLETSDITVTGISVTTADGKTTEKRGTEGYVIRVSGNPFITSANVAQIADRIAQNYVGLIFRPGTYNIKASPTFEAGDALWISTGTEKCIRTIISHASYRPSSVQMTCDAYAYDGAGDLQISQSEYVRKIIDDDLNNPDSNLSQAIKEAGGGGGPDYPVFTNMTVDEAYAKYRPADWLHMVKPGPNEVYLLFHVPVGTVRPIRLRVETGYTQDADGNRVYGDVTIDYGTVSGGAFAVTKTTTYNPYDNGTFVVYEDDISADDCPGAVTSDGMAQMMIRVTSSGGGINYFSPPTKKAETSGVTYNNYPGNIVEARTNLNAATVNGINDFRNLRFLAMYGSENGVYLGYSGSLQVVLDIKAGSLASRPFQYCASLITARVNTGGLAGFSAREMFSNCQNLSAFPEIETGKITDAYHMFYNCSALQYVPEVDFPACTVASDMFYRCTALTIVGDVNMPAIQNNTALFNGCTELMRVGNVAAGRMIQFSNLTALCETGTIDLGTGATALDSMFDGCTELIRIPEIVAPSAKSVANMFRNCKAIDSIDPIASLPMDAVTNANYMFGGCTGLSGDIGDVSLPEATQCSYMFQGCTRLESVGNVSLPKATNASYMFNTSGIESAGDVTLGAAVNASYMFGQCTRLKSVGTISSPLSTNMDYMFTQCGSLKSVDGVTDGSVRMSNMFLNCVSLKSAGALNTARATYVGSIFSGCRSLEGSVELDTSKATSMATMLYECTRVKSVRLSTAGVTSTMTLDVTNLPNMSRFELSDGSKAVGLTLQNCAMYKADLVALFDNVPAVSGTTKPTINIVGNPGVDDLTDEDVAIAEGKGYTVKKY